MNAQVTCGLCEKDGKEFTVPIDEIGVAVMKQHLASEHGIAEQVRDEP